MKTRILASVIIGGVLASSVAQAETAFTIRDLDVIYSGFNPSFTRDVDVSSYYTMPASLQKAAANGHGAACHWIAVKNGLDSINAANATAVESNYLPSRNVKLVC